MVEGARSVGFGRILVVEDEAIVAEDLAATLVELGYEVVATAATAEAAVASAAALAPDLVLMDIRLGGATDGIQAASIIKQARDVPVVFLTAHSDADTLTRALDTQPLGYIVKPFRSPELRCAIELALHRHDIDRRLQDRGQWLATTIRDAVDATDADRRVAFPNPVAQALTGWPEAPGIGGTLEEVLRLVGERPDATSQAPAQPATVSTQVETLQDTAVRNADLEARVLARTKQLEAANQELEAFSFSVAHDLRAPLRGIDGFSQILIEEHAGNLGPEALSHLQRIRAAVARMGRLIEDLLQLSRVARTELRASAVNLTELAGEVLAELRSERDVRVIVAPDLIANGDPGLLRIVLANLLANAWKFTRTCARPEIELGRTTVDGMPAYFVRDNGAGFDPHDASRLFGAFQRLHSAAEFEGTGIGLAIVQRIVHRHGGRVWAVGEVGGGATFSFTLGS